MKIRFYHWWIYRLYRYVWTPIYRAKPDLFREVMEYQSAWLERREKSKPNLRVVK